MGLDMYLEAQFYIAGGYSHIRKQAETEEPDARAVKETLQFDTIIAALGLNGLKGKLTNMNSLEVSVEVAYWRKVNAVHMWFVKNVQGGKDECQRSEVSHEQLRELVDICKQILATVDRGEPEKEMDFLGNEFDRFTNLKLDEELAERLLPTRSGFFFGGTEYDQWYVQGLEDTVSQIETILENPLLTKCEIFYQASW